jgi:hypothetical protein
LYFFYITQIDYGLKTPDWFFILYFGALKCISQKKKPVVIYIAILYKITKNIPLTEFKTRGFYGFIWVTGIL